jgi:hypothetical protein
MAEPTACNVDLLQPLLLLYCIIFMCRLSRSLCFEASRTLQYTVAMKTLQNLNTIPPLHFDRKESDFYNLLGGGGVRPSYTQANIKLGLL